MKDGVRQERWGEVDGGMAEELMRVAGRKGRVLDTSRMKGRREGRGLPKGGREEEIRLEYTFTKLVNFVRSMLWVFLVGENTIEEFLRG